MHMQVKCIWQQAPHNAFTDLVFFRRAFWCVFREGSAHVSPDGSFRILRSEDSENWQSVAKFSNPSADLRDAKFVILPDGRLMLSGTAARHQTDPYKYQGYIWLSEDGVHWTQPQEIGERNIWLWRLIQHNSTYYGLGYHTAQPRFVRFYHGDSPHNLAPVSNHIYQGSYANESALMIEADGTALCLLRRDPDNGLFGTAQPPYTDWQWQDTGCRIGGPQWVRLADGRLLACVRLYDGEIRTSLVIVDRKDGKISEIKTLPSSGDCSYAGMELLGSQLYISYYSSHEGKSAIYFASIDTGKTGI